MKKTCKNCEYWQFFDDRVCAKFSGKDHPTMGNGIWELRRCQWRTHPMVKMQRYSIYTDEFFHCQEWKKIEEK